MNATSRYLGKNFEKNAVGFAQLTLPCKPTSRVRCGHEEECAGWDRVQKNQPLKTVAGALTNHPSQQGATLIISLLILLVLSLIGVTAVQTTALEEKMAGNMRDQNLAFQAAEAALRAGEDWLGQQITEPTPQSSCSTPPCDLVWQINVLNGGDFLDINWWKTSGDTRIYGNATLTEVKTAPRHLIEYHSFLKDTLVIGRQNDEVGRHTYRITARGTGGSDDAQAILQTTYTRRF
ncbi:Tfp pilus assembly protein PilX-like protein [Nitrosococcus halophilus Nc 4]|uniref:Tfp pilus assembly protein PilX-like protein n=1 Tax=Nitrosococcus halophilus (strain Nc4) TaxID=472759 RepID=D5BYA0_NITHN|nr:PilX N-terminal domain-containing pilus assembly protein [Nitrosococcus halophilus]ADE14083.1 Tfp pilus assembly protein PilX-like protein [Nitrosococcus halophilus Nc 4]